MRIRLAAALLALACQGCAHVSVDADGTRHVTGFVRLTLPPAAFDTGADALRVQAVGLTLVRHPEVGSTLVLGYGDTTLVVMRNDARISGPALATALRTEESR